MTLCSVSIDLLNQFFFLISTICHFILFFNFLFYITIIQVNQQIQYLDLAYYNKIYFIKIECHPELAKHTQNYLSLKQFND